MKVMKLQRTYFEVILGIYRVSCYMLKFRYNKNNFLTFLDMFWKFLKQRLDLTFLGGQKVMFWHVVFTSINFLFGIVTVFHP